MGFKGLNMVYTSTDTDRCDNMQSDEPLDPRIQIELEKLNSASWLINELENELQTATYKLRSLWNESTTTLNKLQKKLGTYVEKAQPYYDCRLKLIEFEQRCQMCLNQYELSISIQSAAREMVSVAEEHTRNGRHRYNPAWVETINAANMKLETADENVNECRRQHDQSLLDVESTQEQVKNKHKRLKKYVDKSRVYFEKKAAFNHKVDQQKADMESLKVEVQKAKNKYSKALSNLGNISEQIHQQRANNSHKEISEPVPAEENNNDRVGSKPEKSRRDENPEQQMTKQTRSYGRSISMIDYRRSHGRTYSAHSSGSETLSSISSNSGESLDKTCAILDDEVVETALRQSYFDRSSAEFLLEGHRSDDLEEYTTLPPKLSLYQQEFNNKRRNTIQHADGLKLSEVMKMLESDEELEV